MNPTIFLSCLVVIIGSLACTASAQGDQETRIEFTRLKNIFGNDATHRVTKLRHIPELMDFYEKHPDRFQMTQAERQSADEALMQYKEINQRSERGLSPQGGFFGKFLSLVLTVFVPTLQKAIEPEHLI
ncbi:protein Turandot E-like [Drosophila serrata]|uniref:protein Turandot E-like n=1 Tax=Drosophila serrata TaxID=7274 RepID=UPI000A1D2171|nr:protein Turandot E-like [Drosophila serrata]